MASLPDLFESERNVPAAEMDPGAVSGSPLASEAQAATTRERLAKRIIEMGQKGVRNHKRLVEDALAHLNSKG